MHRGRKAETFHPESRSLPDGSSHQIRQTDKDTTPLFDAFQHGLKLGQRVPVQRQ
ncbi:hypothetical protein AA0229_2275 [Gluconobacter cerinus NRIC 0229]|nr:hypothetical protein AA0229_2275 [Gluconobacter cerinus NRIC 0229]